MKRLSESSIFTLYFFHFKMSRVLEAFTWRCSEKSCQQKFHNNYKKHLCRSIFLIKLQVICNFDKKRFRSRCFLVNFATALRIPFLYSTPGRLLLVELNKPLGMLLNTLDKSIRAAPTMFLLYFFHSFVSLMI